MAAVILGSRLYTGLQDNVGSMNVEFLQLIDPNFQGEVDGNKVRDLFKATAWKICNEVRVELLRLHDTDMFLSHPVLGNDIRFRREMFWKIFDYCESDR